MLVGADRPRQNAAFALEELRVIVAEKQARAGTEQKECSHHHRIPAPRRLLGQAARRSWRPGLDQHLHRDDTGPMMTGARYWISFVVQHSGPDLASGPE